MAYTNNYAGYYLGQPIGAPGVNTYPANNYQVQQPQNNSGNLMTIVIDSDEFVSTYPVAAGTKVQLINFTSGKFWLKETSMAGVPEPIREFSFKEKTLNIPSPQTSGVTREEFDSLSKKIDKLINDLGGTQNG